MLKTIKSIERRVAAIRRHRHMAEESLATIRQQLIGQKIHDGGSIYIIKRVTFEDGIKIAGSKIVSRGGKVSFYVTDIGPLVRGNLIKG
jgi:predicted RNA binding protein with dsRBD fold (UPF0201 family)